MAIHMRACPCNAPAMVLQPLLLHWLVALLFTLIYAALFWVTLQTALKNFDTGTFVMSQSTRLVTWPGYFILPAGFGIAALVTGLRLITPDTAKPEAAK